MCRVSASDWFPIAIYSRLLGFHLLLRGIFTCSLISSLWNYENPWSAPLFCVIGFESTIGDNHSKIYSRLTHTIQRFYLLSSSFPSSFHLFPISKPTSWRRVRGSWDRKKTGSEELESKVDFLYNSELLYNNNCTTEVFLLPIFNSWKLPVPIIQK